MREIRLSGSMSEDVETEHGEPIEALPDERGSSSYGTPKPPRHSSTLLVPNHECGSECSGRGNG